MLRYRRFTSPPHLFARSMEQDQPRLGNVTELLWAWAGGDQSALGKLTPVVYDELHRIACYHISREGDEHTLQTTALSICGWSTFART